MTKNQACEILVEIKKIIPNPVCELNFNNMFELVCAVLLSAQTTDKRVNVVTKELFLKYSTPEKMMNATYDDIYHIIASLGFAKTKTIHLLELAKKLHQEYNDIVPNTMEELILLPGVGRKTASVVLAVGFKIPAMPVDTHLHRLAYRLGFISKTASVLEAEKAYKKYIPKEEWIEAHHLILLFGRYYCKAINPLCEECKLKEFCKK